MKKKSIFVIGDSISIHYGPYLKKAVEGKYLYDRKRGIDQAIEDLDTPTGANGGDSRQVLQYLTEEKTKGVSYDILLINCGLHDIRRNFNKEGIQIELNEYKKNLSEITSLAKSISNKVIWVESTPVVDDIHNSKSETMRRYNEDLEQYNKSAAEIMKSKGIEIIPLNGFTEKLGKEAYCDHIHFNEKARELQAEFIAEYLERL